MKYDIFRTGRSFASSGKSFFPIPARKKRYYVSLKALWGQNEGKDNILGIQTEGRTHFRKYLIAGIIQKHSRILETFSLMLIKSLWDGLEIGSFVGTWQSLNSKQFAIFSKHPNCCIFLNILIVAFFYPYLLILISNLYFFQRVPLTADFPNLCKTLELFPDFLNHCKNNRWRRWSTINIKRSVRIFKTSERESLDYQIDDENTF